MSTDKLIFYLDKELNLKLIQLINNKLKNTSSDYIIRISDIRTQILTMIFDNFFQKTHRIFTPIIRKKKEYPYKYHIEFITSLQYKKEILRRSSLSGISISEYVRYIISSYFEY